MTLQLVTFIYDFLYAKCYVIHIVLDRIKSNQIKNALPCWLQTFPPTTSLIVEGSRELAGHKCCHCRCCSQQHFVIKIFSYSSDHVDTPGVNGLNHDCNFSIEMIFCSIFSIYVIYVEWAGKNALLLCWFQTFPAATSLSVEGWREGIAGLAGHQSCHCCCHQHFVIKILSYL